ncbi:hypothetical protein N7474_006272 [Penicillium riverlandense]|uniref:uncharacterized protein n=1 Tax=Penicillium riverlandense TaxID=1903569 RepID=UPI002549099D|nr:uncharacterized protein N7474_006272 [Penicillium riverlandense]KAJ5814495.1 hypothetical protein N7474_006272 [Penicillium riverlandense]
MPAVRFNQEEGGADGFGSGIVDRFSKEGWNVILMDLSKDKGEAKAKAKPKLQFLLWDVTNRETWKEALDWAQNDYGRVDVVVNNAEPPFPLHEKSIEEYDRIFSINVKPIFLSAQVFALFMLEQGSGAFINMTSTGCIRPRPGFAIYNASKAAVTLFTKTMALEYAPTIRFNCIAPPVGNTAMLRATIGEDETSAAKLRMVEDSLPMKRVTQPTDIANAAWYLGSDESPFVTGTTLEVDGGRGI